MNDREEVCMCEGELYEQLLDSCDCVGICNPMERRNVRMYRKEMSRRNVCKSKMWSHLIIDVTCNCQRDYLS